jgi:hypothetical protein
MAAPELPNYMACHFTLYSCFFKDFTLRAGDRVPPGECV